MGDKFEFPTDPEVRTAGAIALGALVILVAIARIFRDVNPA